MKPVYWLILGIALIGGCTVFGVASLFVEEPEVTEIVSDESPEAAAETPTPTPKPTKTPEPEGFKSMDDWAKEKCGDKNAVRDQIREALLASPLEKHDHSGVREGWLAPDKAKKSDFPKRFRTPIRTEQKNQFGVRELGIMFSDYNYECVYVDGDVLESGFE